jgi:hypothetical protein
MEILTRLGLIVEDDPYGIPWRHFQIGTCVGQWRSVDNAYEILLIINKERGNGHLDDVFEWFEYACRRDGKALRIREVMNERFGQHLVDKRGFVQEQNEDLIKYFPVLEVAR